MKHTIIRLAFSLLLLAALGCASGLTPAQEAARAACKADVYSSYLARTDECDDEACIEAERPRLKKEQEACP
jgi:hypothetical protein